MGFDFGSIKKKKNTANIIADDIRKQYLDDINLRTDKWAAILEYNNHDSYQHILNDIHNIQKTRDWCMIFKIFK